jgi:uncharacterized membrane protein YeiB
VASSERIQALDVVRGFALIGIFLMNIEFFNRPISDIDQGLPAGLTGADWWAGWLIYKFVQGKFWTMFSLLFGMGFAVMLSRAERAERNFIRPYLRRIAALAVFGVLHHVFIWGGDILFSYAVAAIGLLILLFGNWIYIFAAVLPLAALGMIPGFEPVQQVVGSLCLVSIAALFLRGEWKRPFLGRSLPMFSIAFLAIGSALSLATLALWLVPGAPTDPRTSMTVMSTVVLAIGVLSARFHDPADLRSRRLGVAMYILPLLLMTIFGAKHYFAPASDQAPVPASRTESVAEIAERAERNAEREKSRKEQALAVAREQRVATRGSYLDGVKFRARDFANKAPGTAGFATLVIGMFLIGNWFVRSGVMANTGAHLPFFRRLALIALPFGLGLGLLASAIATRSTPGLENDPHQMAMGLMAMGNLPACLGYVSLIVLMLHSRSALSKVAVLAPLGRMALTNYLTQSLICSWYFYGYGLGHWGMPRAWQVVFVAVVIVLQLIVSHWWLSQFRFGPMEWLWRAITYWQVPPMRRERTDTIEDPQLSA